MRNLVRFLILGLPFLALYAWAAEREVPVGDKPVAGYKLVRDKYPQIFELEGETRTVVQIPVKDRPAWLYAKLVEELREFSAETTAEEMADMLQVLHSLQAHFGLDPAEVERVRLEKLALKGSFDCGFLLKLGDTDTDLR